MALSDQQLLSELFDSLTTSSYPPFPSSSGAWSSQLDDSLSNWLIGRPGSMARPRLANAIRAKVSPREAADWWERMLTLEESGQVVASMPDGVDSIAHRVGYFQGYEPTSGTFWGWSLIAEAAALQLLRYQPLASTACDLLRRSIRRHIGLASLFAVNDLIIRGPKGQPIYQGPAVLSPGALTKGVTSANYRPINSVFVHAINRPPARCRFDRVTKLASYAVQPDTWPLDDDEDIAIYRLIGALPVSNAQLVESAEYVINRLLDSSTRIIVPFTIRRYTDSIVAWMARNPNISGGATYLSHVGVGRPATEGDSVIYLYPYGDRSRVRSKSVVGEGSLTVVETHDGDVAVCENLRPDEFDRLANEGRRPIHNTVQLKLPSSDQPLFEVSIGPDSDPSIRSFV